MTYWLRLLKAGLFYGVIAMSWSVINVALRISADNAGTVNMQKSLEAVYLGFNLIAILAFGYLMIKFLWWGSTMMIPKRHSDDDMKGW